MTMLAEALSPPGPEPTVAALLAAPTAHRIDLGDHLVFLRFRPNPRGLAVLFDGGAPGVDRLAERRRAVGETAALRSGYATLSVLPKSVTAFRTPDLAAFFDGLAASGALEPYRPLITLGHGLGGYAALAFARTLGAARSLAIGPVLTLDPRLAPAAYRRARADRRLSAALRRDWTGPRSDGAAEISDLEALTLVYDPLDPSARWDRDRLAAARGVSAARDCYARAPGLGADLTGALRELGALDALIASFLAGRAATPRCWPRRLRARRACPAYAEALTTHRRATPRRRQAVERGCAAAGATRPDAAAMFAPQRPSDCGGIERPARSAP